MLVIAVLLSACTDSAQKEDDEIFYHTYDHLTADSIYDHTTWGCYQGDAITDKETALEVAKAVFYGTIAKEGSYMRDYKPYYVSYYEAEGIWSVTFTKTASTMGGYWIAIQKSDGKILKMELGE